MTRHQAGSLTAGLAALGFAGIAALHSTGYPGVVRAAVHVPGPLQPLMPALWLAFSLDLLVVGAIVGVVALRPGGAGRVILAVAAASPIGAAVLQLWFIGFIPPTALLLGLALLTLAAAAVMPPQTRRPQG